MQHCLAIRACEELVGGTLLQTLSHLMSRGINPQSFERYAQCGNLPPSNFFR